MLDDVPKYQIVCAIKEYIPQTPKQFKDDILQGHNVIYQINSKQGRCKTDKRDIKVDSKEDDNITKESFKIFAEEKIRNHLIEQNIYTQEKNVQNSRIF